MLRRGGARRRFPGARGVAVGFACAVAIFGGAVTASADDPAPPRLVVALSTMPGGEHAGNAPEPTLLVYSDGHAVHNPKHPSDKKQEKGHVPLDVVHDAAAKAKKLAEVDMGMPEGGDGGSTLLDFLGTSPDQDVHLVVYSPTGTDGLNDEQKAGRARFTKLCKKLVDAFEPDH